MIAIRSNFHDRSPLDGSPYSKIIREKSKSRMRKAYQIFILVIVLHLIYRHQISPVPWDGYFILLIFLIPSFFILMDNFIIVEGDHGNWTVSKVKQFRRWGIVHQRVQVENIVVEINVISQLQNSISLLVIKNEIQDIKIKAINLRAKEFLNDCEIINLQVNINKRGKLAKDFS